MQWHLGLCLFAPVVGATIDNRAAFEAWAVWRCAKHKARSQHQNFAAFTVQTSSLQRTAPAREPIVLLSGNPQALLCLFSRSCPTVKH